MGCNCRHGGGVRALRQEPITPKATSSRAPAPPPKSLPAAPKSPTPGTLSAKVSALVIKHPKLSALLAEILTNCCRQVTDEDIRKALERARKTLPQYEEAIAEVLR